MSLRSRRKRKAQGEAQRNPGLRRLMITSPRSGRQKVRLEPVAGFTGLKRFLRHYVFQSIRKLTVCVAQCRSF
jgi:hypothetical protein